jgi:hypothetical protein
MHPLDMLLPEICQLIDAVKVEWSQQGCWSEWDQSVRDRITAYNISRNADPIRVALVELVACKDLKDSLPELAAKASATPWLRATEDYERRQPLAWKAARAALDPTPAWVKLSDEIEATPPQGGSHESGVAPNEGKPL